jgi:MFS family permease
MVAAPFAAIISDRFGRRKGMFAGAAVIIIGAVIATTSKHIAQVRHTLLFLGYGRIEGW